MEASGTSGMKALLNGVLNCSIGDGWWAEAYRPDSGWLIPENGSVHEYELRNELHAENLIDCWKRK